MNCIVCDSKMVKYFSKDFHGRFGLSIVRYERCPVCGFFASRTHYEMSGDEWGKLNHDYHTEINRLDSCPDDPNWRARQLKQADYLAGLKDVFSGVWLDWGCGDGNLADLLQKRGIRVDKYDKYLHNVNLHDKYSFVYSTSVWEHVRDRLALEAINLLVNEGGAHGVHTFVACDNMICDADWFYLLPVHCSFYTEKAMKILFSEWGYKECIYHEATHFWIMTSEITGFIHPEARVASDFFIT